MKQAMICSSRILILSSFLDGIAILMPVLALNFSAQHFLGLPLTFT
jgi:hypothetical protein